MNLNKPVLKTSAEIARLKRPARAVGKVLFELRERVMAGVRINDLAEFCEKRLRAYGVQPAQQGYKGFPGTVSVSIGAIAAHGVPDHSQLSPGDVLTVDVVAEHDGWYADAAWSYVVEPAMAADRNLVTAAWECSLAGVRAARAGGWVNDIGRAVQRRADELGCRVLERLCGHGIGREIHEDPLIRFSGEMDIGVPLVPGMVLTIEPVVTFGSGKIELMEDGFGYVTCDGSPTAQFEHMIALAADTTHLISVPGGVPLPGLDALWLDSAG